MADYADIASEITEIDLEHSLLNARRIEVPSLYECEDYGEEIPEKRRRLGSVTLCVACQTVLEAKQKHIRGAL